MVDLHPIHVAISPSVRPTPRIVPLATVRSWARRVGNPNASRQDIAGITVPGITVDVRGIRFEQRRNLVGNMEFRYERGVLAVQTYSLIFISNRLSECERRIWTAHEFDHVRDYERLNERLLARVQVNPFLRSVFVERQWLPRNSFDVIQTSIREACYRIYREFTAEASRRRDTSAEYQRIRNRVRANCGRSRRGALRPRRST